MVYPYGKLSNKEDEKGKYIIYTGNLCISFINFEVTLHSLLHDLSDEQRREYVDDDTYKKLELNKIQIRVNYEMNFPENNPVTAVILKKKEKGGKIAVGRSTPSVEYSGENKEQTKYLAFLVNRKIRDDIRMSELKKHAKKEFVQSLWYIADEQSLLGELGKYIAKKMIALLPGGGFAVSVVDILEEVYESGISKKALKDSIKAVLKEKLKLKGESDDAIENALDGVDKFVEEHYDELTKFTLDGSGKVKYFTIDGKIRSESKLYFTWKLTHEGGLWEVKGIYTEYDKGRKIYMVGIHAYGTWIKKKGDLIEITDKNIKFFRK